MKLLSDLRRLLVHAENNKQDVVKRDAMRVNIEQLINLQKEHRERIKSWDINYFLIFYEQQRNIKTSDCKKTL